ncbi:hypothetical protein IE53DRAFT_368451 [Violaceomyces palustris]|uniref:Uncharacterized protein n=1 Tax=Violaceomyces palustris TaxID=1673888 RepID=A0ACD0NYS7_9BASI|nr:hypothetical protein IE53DRAFT_368451 [Violaceomyces palustris]
MVSFRDNMNSAAFLGVRAHEGGDKPLILSAEEQGLIESWVNWLMTGKRDGRILRMRFVQRVVPTSLDRPEGVYMGYYGYGLLSQPRTGYETRWYYIPAHHLMPKNGNLTYLVFEHTFKDHNRGRNPWQVRNEVAESLGRMVETDSIKMHSIARLAFSELRAVSGGDGISSFLVPTHVTQEASVKEIEGNGAEGSQVPD